MAKKREKRKLIICPNCRHEMVCMNKFESIYNLIRGLFVWYVCPRREDETGCGHSVLLEVSPKTKRLGKIVSSVGFAKDKSRRKSQK